MDFKKEIGNRLKEFGLSKFNTVKEFAESLEMAPSALQSSYFKGRSAPGAEIIIKLKKMGCDINWLLTGEIDKETDLINNYNIKIKRLEQENARLRADLDNIINVTKKITSQKKRR